MPVDISNLPPPPGAGAPAAPVADISQLPPPPQAGSNLPPPPSGATAPPSIANLPPPPGTKPEDNKSTYLTPEETQGIAAKYGVDADHLASIAPYHGVNLVNGDNPITYGLKSTVGEIGSMAGLGVPQFAYRKLALSEDERKALDELKAASEERKNGLQKTTEFARGFVAPVGVPRLLGKTAPALLKFGEGLAGSAGLGAVAGAAGAPEGQEAQGAVRGAKWGAILHTGLEGVGALARIGPRVEARRSERQLPDIETEVGKIAEQTAPSEKIVADALAESLDTGEVPKLSDDQVEVISKQQFPDNPEPDRAQAEGFVENRLRDYAEDVTGSRPKTLTDAVDTLRSRTDGPEYLSNRYGDFVKGVMADRAGVQINNQKGFWGKAGDFISDSQYVLRDMDRRTGSTVEPVLNRLNKDYNQSTYKLADWRKRMEEVYRKNEKVGVDGNTLYEEMKSGQVPEEHAQAAQNVSKFFNDFYNFQTSRQGADIAPLGTRKMENYIPEYAKPVAEIIPMIEKRRDMVLDQASQMTGRQVQDLSQLSPEEFTQVTQSGPGKELLEFSGWGDARGPVKDGRALEQKLDQTINSDRGRQALEIVAKSSLERQGGTPDFLLEKNVYKLMSMYTANTIRGMYLRRGIDQLRYQYQALEKAGANVDAQYVKNLIQDIQGSREGTAATANRKIKTQYYRNMDKLIERAGGSNTVAGGALTAAKAMPDILREISLQIYPASMGLNLRSAIQTGTATLSKLAPELGGAYGYKTLGKAALMSMKNFGRQLAEVRAQGFLPQGFVRNGEIAIAEGLQASALYQIPRQMLDGMSKTLMSLHQFAENCNRVITRNAGEIMGRELAAGDRGAIASLNRFPRSIQRQVARAGGDAGQIGDILAKHLNDTTAYNYNRMSMNQFGRTMGPMFSVFTKWPAATAGDIIATYREKGLLAGSLRNAEKYLAPALLLHSLSMATTGHHFFSAEDDLSDRQKQLVGSHGLVQAAPITSVMAMAKGETGIPPAVAILYHGIVSPLLEGKVNRDTVGDIAHKTTAQVAQSFLPGAGILRFLTQDMVTWITGRKPEGDFFDRTAEGAHRLNRMMP